MSMAKRGPAPLALFACLMLGASITTGDSIAPPPPVPCSSDLDCAGCLRCEGATETKKGACETAQAQTECMCDADCLGGSACSLSPQKPLCGGLCRAGAPAPELACGAGADVAFFEPFAPSIVSVPAAVQVVAEEELVVETFEVQP